MAMGTRLTVTLRAHYAGHEIYAGWTEQIQGVIAVGLGQVGEFVHDAKDATVGGFGDTAILHLP